MKTIIPILGTVLLTLGIAFNAGAAPYTFDMGAGSSVDTSGTNDVLKMFATVNENLDDIIFSLDDGQSETFYFATIGTTETWVNDDDIQPGEITANIDFDIPDMTSAVDGKSIGFAGCFHFIQGWILKWDDPVSVDLGETGEFTIELSDVAYGSWCWQGPDGTADVSATITYNPGGSSSPAPVPEPSTILLMGIGLAGLATLGRKRLNRY
ncbi:MAG: PEP-CTERM sorting domain-containing protein [Thermodesulfobacteriota bacterium]|nr:PEP-CTERM sorting domain-containing protein [Thermodesulfobacteriota bacterium]